jgi:hypothetical protein
MLEPPKEWRVHNGRVNRDCISKAEYERRMEERRAAGLMLDPSTAEIDWNYGQTLDPYGDGLPLLPHEDQAVNISRALLTPTSGSVFTIFPTRRET